MVGHMNDSKSEKGLSANWAVREVDHLIGRLARYTRFVAYSKWVLLAFALIMLVALVLWPMVSAKKSGTRISFVGGGKAPGQGSISPTMASPVYEGTDKAGRPYRITGAKATQASDTLIVIDTVEGQLTTSDSFVSVTADRAEYAKDREAIELIGAVNVISGKGYMFQTPQATVDLQTQEVRGNERITGEGPMGNLLATGFEIRDNGNRIRFGGQGRVTVVITKTNDAA